MPRQKTEKKGGLQIAKEGIKLSLFADNMISYRESPKDSTKESLALLKYNINIRKYDHGKLHEKENNPVYSNYRKKFI